MGRKNAMTYDRVIKAKELLADDTPVKDMLPIIQKMKGPTISRSRLIQWVNDMRELEPEDHTDDR